MRADLADGLVKPFHHRMVFRGVERRGLVAILREQAFRRRVRVMRHHRRIPGEERLTVLLRAADEIRERRQGLAADVEAFVAVAAPLGHAFGETAGLIRTHPPLARLQADVALLAEEAGQDRRFLEALDHLGATIEESGVLLFSGGGFGRAFGAGGDADGDERVVAGQAVTMDVPAGQHRGEARSAEGIRDIATREDARLRRELVEVRRADRFRTHEAVIKPSMVVRDDHEDVGAVGRRQRQAETGEHSDAKG